MDISTFAQNHTSQIAATIGLVTFALAKNKLTPGGIVVAILRRQPNATTDDMAELKG